MVNQLNLILDKLFGDIKSILLIVAVILFLYLFIKFKGLRSLLVIILIVATIISGVFSTYYVGEYYFRKGVTVGSVINSLFDNNVAKYEKSDTYTFVYEKMGFASTGVENEYQSKITETREVDIDLKQNWNVYINDIECNNNNVEDNEISASFTNAFYNIDKELILEDTLNIRLIFNKKTMEIYLTTQGGDDAVKYWNTYLDKNGFELTIKNATKNTSVIEIDKLPDLLTLTTADGTTYQYQVGSTLIFPDNSSYSQDELSNIVKSTVELIIPEGVQQIGCIVEMFEKINKDILSVTFENLTTLHLPSTLIPNSDDYVPFVGIATKGIKIQEISLVPKLQNLYLSKTTSLDGYKFSYCTTLSNIYFDGNIADWTIEKASDISSSTQITVHCNDGDIVI